MSERDDVIELLTTRWKRARDISLSRTISLSDSLTFAGRAGGLSEAIEVIKAASSPAPLTKCPHSDGNSCEQYRLQGQRCQDCRAPRSDDTDALKAEIVKWRTACELAETEAEAAKDRAEEHATRRVNAETQRDQCEQMLLAARAPRSDEELREAMAIGLFKVESCFRDHEWPTVHNDVKDYWHGKADIALAVLKRVAGTS